MNNNNNKSYKVVDMGVDSYIIRSCNPIDHFEWRYGTFNKAKKELIAILENRVQEYKAALDYAIDMKKEELV